MVSEAGGDEFSLSVATSEAMKTVKSRIAVRLGLGASFDLTLVCGSEPLADAQLVSELSEHRLLAVIVTTLKVETIGPRLNGDFKYLARGVLAPNGCIYFAPHNAYR